MLRCYSTGQVAQMLGVTEPKVAELVRRGRLTPPPQIVAGRRLWGVDHVRKAAELLGLDPSSRLEALDAEEAG